ncbi:hypothetical protein [Hyalangium sp.]|uniref:hypothetical protein n=1 Tax=Hyalangium sp. TaxID=2028555 RepID=UPI00389B02C1
MTRAGQAARRAFPSGKREALTVIVPIDADPPGRKEQLETVLKQLGNDIRNNSLMDFSALEGVHFLSWSILPGVRDECGREGPARLSFEANFDGPREEFLEQLIRKAGEPLKEELYRYCGLSRDADVVRFKDFLLEHAVEAALPYNSYAGLSASKIQNDAQVHREFHQLVTQAYRTRPMPLAPVQGLEDDLLNREVDVCFASIQRKLEAAATGDGLAGLGVSSGGTSPLEYDAEPDTWRTRLEHSGPVRFLRSLHAAPAILMGGALLAHEALSAAWEEWQSLRRKGPSQPVPPESARARKQREKQQEAERKQREKMVEIQNREDHQAQNHLTHLAELKPGLLRPPVLRLMLWGWKQLAKYFFTDGNLGGIEGIHFARWVLIDGGRQWWPPPRKDGHPRRLSLSRKRYYLLFFSNYDGSWESYLDDFINRGNLGLTTIWCNTEGFPKPRIRWRLDGRLPRLSIQRGGNRETAFKRWVRQHQLPTLTWYSRHPDKSVSNIRRNREIRARAAVPMSSRKRSQWLQLL